jgi:hypothetical protein
MGGIPLISEFKFSDLMLHSAVKVRFSGTKCNMSGIYFMEFR